ncbi:MAG: HAD-IB family phosphatase [Clostridia bacterium]|nr:HAD-IB family phosphatase [Clostridia bacterium]
MNCYDFDKTIYKSDSSCDFYLFCLKRYPAVIKHWPAQLGALIRHYVFHSISKTAMKEVFYRYFREISDMQAALSEFWAAHLHKVKDFYKAQQQPEDVIISASPEFFLKPACEALGIVHLIASPVNKKTGAYEGENCHGKEKVRRFRALFPEAEVDAFYSDSLSDTPMAELSKDAYLVKGDSIMPWPEKV